MHCSARKSVLLLLLSALLSSYIIFVCYNPLKMDDKPPTDNPRTMTRGKQNSAPQLKGWRRLIVFDAVDHPGSLAFLNDPPSDWTTLVINHRTRQQVETCRQCVFVSAEWALSYLLQASGASTVLKTLPEDAGVKVKLATYLYVTSLKLEWIYVTNKAQEVPFKALARVVDNDHDLTTGPVYAGKEVVFEPCRHFVDPITWQRPGRPIGAPERYNLKNVTRRSVYFVVDECFRSDVTEDRWKESLDQRAPIPFVMPGTFGVLDFHNALIPTEAMWTLVAALQSPRPRGESRMTPASLKVNLIVQRILWETPNLIGFLPSLPRQKTCSICDLATGIESLGEDFRKTTIEWRCDVSKSVSLCLEELVKVAFGNGNTTSLVKTWLHYYSSSQSAGAIAERQTLTPEKLHDKFVGRPILYSPPTLLRKKFENDCYPPNTFSEICRKGDLPYMPLIPDTNRRTDVLLIIVINDIRYAKNIPLLEYLYRRYFQHIIYCAGSNDIEGYIKTFQVNNPTYPVSLLTVERSTYQQVCTTGAIKMNYDVIGYFQFSDDVLVNLWNYHHLPMDRPWFQSFIGNGDISAKNLYRPEKLLFNPWPNFKVQTNNAWKQLQLLKNDLVHGRDTSKFLNTLSVSTNCSSCIHFANSDIFYVPQSIAKEFSYFAEFFYGFSVQFEIAIITVLGGLVPSQDIVRLDGLYIWGKQRDKYRDLYKKDDHFYHPWKLSLLKLPEGSSFFCQKYVKQLDLDLQKKVGPRRIESGIFFP